MMKDHLYIVYGLGILICVIILNSYKAKGWLDLTNFFVLVVMLVLIIALLASVMAPATFGVVKKVLLSLFIGIGVIALLLVGISAYDTYSQRSQRDKQLAKEKEHIAYYSSWEMLKSISVVYNEDEARLRPITAEIVLSADSVLDGWNAEFIVIARPKDDNLLKDYSLFKSDRILIGKERKLTLTAKHLWNIYKIEALQRKIGDTISLEYLLLLRNPNEVPSKYGLNEGLAYTSLPNAEIEVQNGIFKNVSGKKHTLIQSAKMPAARQIPLTILDTEFKEETKPKKKD